MYPGLYQRTNNTSTSRGANMHDLQQQTQQEYAQAQMIQQQYLQVQAAAQVQVQALQRAAMIQKFNARNGQPSSSSAATSSSKGRQDEPITLSSDDEESQINE